MAVKYQVFVSSTFTDLQEERQVVSRSILELNHIPAGMELFPAFDQSQLDFIKRVIDDCDYYLLIVGGKYGSVTAEGVSFTESEYDYAVSKKKPIIALLHSDISSIPSGKVENDGDRLDKLEKFKTKVSAGRLVKFWSSKDDLKSSAIISLTSSFDQKPQIGWRRNDSNPDPVIMQRMEELRARDENAREQIKFLRKKLLSHEDLVSAEIEMKYERADDTSLAHVSAYDLIREFAASLKRGFDEDQAFERATSLIAHKYDPNVTQVTSEAVENIMLFFEVFDIAGRDILGDLIIKDDMLHLLKAAFKKQDKDSAKVELDDEIPF